MTTERPEPIAYPIARYDDLTLDPVYLELQQRGPIWVQLDYGDPCWVATSYQDVKTVYGDRRFVKELGIGRDTPRMIPTRFGDDPSIIAHMDPPRHTRLRRLTAGAFSPAQIKQLTGWLDGIADDLLGAMVEHGTPVDFVDVMSWNLPLRVITGILGVAESDIPIFRGWIDQLMSVSVGVDDQAKAHVQLVEYVKGLIADRRADRTDDLLSVMVHTRDEDDQLNEDELVSLALSLFLAGFETTAAQIGSSVATLLAYRHLWQELVDDRELLPAAMEELWRWIPSFRHGMPMIQWASEDIELSHGVVIPKGEAVVPEHQVANRDESVFPRASEIDFHRASPEPHLSLAWGAHRCLGAHLANLEIERTLLGLLRRFPSLELAIAPADIKWSTSTFLRGPAELPLAW